MTSRMARKPLLLQRIVAGDATLAAWEARRRQETRLTEALRRHLPRSLADRVRVADAQSSELQLEVGAGAIAAVLRQQTPTLLAALRREDWKFSAISVRVQVRPAPPPIRKTPPHQVDRSALQPLAGLAQALPPGPLKRSLDRLLRRLG
jgi:hypothetical protein